jgi:hypothetical protein
MHWTVNRAEVCLQIGGEKETCEQKRHWWHEKGGDDFATFERAAKCSGVPGAIIITCTSIRKLVAIQYENGKFSRSTIL